MYAFKNTLYNDHSYLISNQYNNILKSASKTQAILLLYFVHYKLNIHNQQFAIDIVVFRS